LKISGDGNFQSQEWIRKRMDRVFYIDTINKTVNFSFDYDEELIKWIKASDWNARWNPEFQEWIIPVNDYSKPRILSIIRNANFEQKKVAEVGDVDVDYERTEVDYAYLRGLCDSKDFEYKARTYQLEALGFALEKGNIINGDDVGLGKTFESILYAEVTNSFPCLVVTPATVKYNWAKEWTKITKGKRSVSVIESKETKSRRNDWTADVIIINYDIIGKKQGRGTTLRFDELGEIDFKMNIFDEAHFLKNSKSQRANAAARLVKGEKRIQLLTGTATMNKPVELWNLLKLVKSSDKISKDWQQFIYRYCGGYRGKFGWVTDGATNTLELNKLLRETCYIRREKKQVLTELPDFISQAIEIPITNKKDYERAQNDFLQFILEEEGLEKMEKASEAEQLVALGRLRRMAIEGKQKAIEGYLKDWIETERKLIVFGIHTETLEYLSDKFKCPLIAGGVSSKKKQEIKEKWIKSDDQFLFGNIESLGTGVDGLQHVCSDVVFMELPWRPSDLTQAIGRVHRSGQIETPSIIYLLSDWTIDSEMWEMLEEKEAVTEAVNKGVDIRRNKSGMKNVMKKMLTKAKKK